MRHKNKVFLLSCICLVIVLLVSSVSIAASNKIKWNDENIQWYTYNEGLNLARIDQKPIILIIYANWCSTCKSYGKVFRQDKIVKAASDFIMIRVNKDDDRELSKSYGYDGEYIPRTFAISSEGEVMHQLYPEKSYKYYIGVDSRSLLSLMRKALKNN